MNPNTNNASKNTRQLMRTLHNYVGFFIAGLVIIYALSGIVQIYRDTDFLKHDVSHVKTLAPNLEAGKLKDALRMKDFNVERTENGVIYFKNGNYNVASGVANYTTKEWYGWINQLTELHKFRSKENGHTLAHYFTTIFGILLMFMSISAFWMFKPGTKLFSRGVYITIAGLIAAVILIFL